jgi:hypothetical protein
MKLSTSNLFTPFFPEFHFEMSFEIYDFNHKYSGYNNLKYQCNLTPLSLIFKYLINIKMSQFILIKLILFSLDSHLILLLI